MRIFIGAILFVFTAAALPADFQTPREGTWVVKDFRFHSGEVLPELKLHYTTVGEPGGLPVVIMHGTTGSGTGLLAPGFGGELFGPGQVLDGKRYFVILPDAIGHGKSSKPSDGLGAKFPRYDYTDMVDAQQRLVSEHLGVKRARLVMGNSMGGMETWIWAQRYPGFMDVAVPMASVPAAMSSRNWMLRRLIIDSIRRDPKNAQFASVFFGIATNGGNWSYYKAAPTREKADRFLDERLNAKFTADPDDVLYQWDSSRDYDPSAGLEKIEATLMAINSADDERNPVDVGVLDREIKRVKRGSVLLIPTGEQTLGHGTTGQARFWKGALADLLKSAPYLAAKQ